MAFCCDTFPSKERFQDLQHYLYIYTSWLRLRSFTRAVLTRLESPISSTRVARNKAPSHLPLLMLLNPPLLLRLPRPIPVSIFLLVIFFPFFLYAFSCYVMLFYVMLWISLLFSLSDSRNYSIRFMIFPFMASLACFLHPQYLPIIFLY